MPRRFGGFRVSSNWIYRTWLPSSGLVPADQPGFEAFTGLPFEHGFEHLEFALQLPVE